MKLRVLKIHNFRSIRNATIDLYGYTLLLGANNCGKSTIVDCLRATYEKDKYKFIEQRDFPTGDVDDNESWSELEFELTKSEYEQLAPKYRLPNHSLRLRKTFKSKNNKSLIGMLTGYLKDETLEKKPFYGAKGVQNGKIGDIIYIPAVSTVDDHTKLSGPSALRDLLSDLLSNVVEGSESYKRFADHYKSFVVDAREAKDQAGRSLSAFEQELDDKLETWDTGFKLSFRPPEPKDLIKSLVDWTLLDELTNNNAAHTSFGSGFQRHFIFSLISVGAKYTKSIPSKKSTDFTPSLSLLLFEEPEAFLHPPQQTLLSNDLKVLSAIEGWQVIGTTHSPHFVSRNSEDLCSLVRLNKNAGESKAYQLKQDDWQEILDSRAELEAIVGGPHGITEDVKENFEIIRYFLWLNPDRSGLFFAQKVILVEGLTEVGLLNRLITKDEIKLPRCEYHVLNCEGKYNIHRFVRFLKKLGVDHVVIFDEDGGKGNHNALNTLIENEARGPHTLGVLKIVGNLESYLGMPKPNDRLKPQQALHNLETGNFNPDNLMQFCRDLERLLK